MKRIYTLILLLSVMVVNTFAQGNVGIGTNNPVNSAALDITASDKGLLIPRVSLSSAITFGLTGTATAGMLVFNTNTTMTLGMGVGFYYWNGVLWAKIIENTSVTLTNGTILIGNASNIPVERTISGDATVTNTGVLTIANNAVTTAKIANDAVDGTKINLTGNANGDLMYYNGTDWVRLASGTTGQILQTNGAAAPTWVNANTTFPKKDVTTATTGVTVGNGTGQVIGASNMTIDVATNSSTSPGLVASGSGQNTKVWGTDASGNPAWKDPNGQLTTKDVTTTTTGVTVGSGTGQVIGASNMTIDIATNSSTSPGLVASGSGQNTKVWGTDASGNPAWKDPNGQLTKGNLTETTSSVLTITNGTGAVLGSGTTIQVKANALNQAGTVAAPTAASNPSQVWGTDASGNPAWKNVGTVIKAQNGVNVNTGTPNATATDPYVELGGTLVRPTTVSGLTATNKMSFTGTGVDAFNVDGTTLSIDATNDRVGIGTAAPTSPLSVGSSNQFQVNSTGNIVKLNNVTTNFPATQGAANSILTNDGSGNLSWSTTNGGSQVFFYTGSDQYLKVPANVTKISVKLWGGGGSGSAFNDQACGGGAGFVSGDLAVTPGDMLRIIVGRGGFSDDENAYGGGGIGYSQAGGGGGRSAIRLKNGTTDLVTAGGGGGAGDETSSGKNCYGGAGGGTTGGTGGYSNGSYTSAAGKGGTQSSGGAGGNGTSYNGGNGSAYQGGDGNSRDWEGGGGGGGYYGGGGGAGYYGGGGGGGSSYVSGLTGTVTNTQGVSGTGGAEKAPGGSGDADYISGIGTGGKQGIGGGPGLVIIYW